MKTLSIGSFGLLRGERYIRGRFELVLDNCLRQLGLFFRYHRENAP